MAEAELTTVARPYARAAFSYALGQDDGLAKWSRMLALLGAAADTDVLHDALDNPQLSHEQEAGILIDLLSDELNPACQNFVHILAENDRLTLLQDISELFEDLKAQHEKTMDVEITSAFDVSDADKDKLAEALKSRLQKEIDLVATVDESLLGGVIIRMEDTVIDNSMRGRLEKLAQALT
ncbi:MAG: F0F1 ATP synthase subunit delta [Gammaproteobacteria bacterium]|nr:F0F1 ATP synthase subunit delta [Gammaproteobacteria bacterium]